MMKVSRACSLVESKALHGMGSWIHEKPSKKQCNSDTGRVHCTLCRFTAAGNGLVILQVDQNKEQRLYAKRGPWNSRIRFTILDSTMQPVGWLRQVTSNFSCHAYELTMVAAAEAKNPDHDAETPVAVMLYQVPSLKEFISKLPPRTARVALFAYYETESNKVEPAPERDETNRAGWISLESKDPYLKPTGRRGLDFAGRGSGSSAKNMQLVLPAEHDKSKIVIQMVKCQARGRVNRRLPLFGKEKRYHVDFAAPTTPFQAFGFALAQLDL